MVEIALYEKKVIFSFVLFDHKRSVLKHAQDKNVSNWVTFLWQAQIQTIKYGLNDMKPIKKKQATLTPYSFTPFDMKFQTILMPKKILAKFMSQKVYSLRPFLT